MGTWSTCKLIGQDQQDLQDVLVVSEISGRNWRYQIASREDVVGFVYFLFFKTARGIGDALGLMIGYW